MTDALPNQRRRSALKLLAGLPFAGLVVTGQGRAMAPAAPGIAAPGIAAPGVAQPGSVAPTVSATPAPATPAPASPAPATPAPATPSAIQDATVLVAGPDGGMLDRWGRVVQPALAQGLPPETVLTVNSVGGADGVTGANQFTTLGDPDGRTLLLAPGDAAAAWLVGDPRAKYDPGRWTSLLACVTPGVLVVRPGLPSGKQTVRLAIPAMTSGALAGLLALEILGATAEPVLTMPGEAVAAAFGQGAIDAAFLLGHNVDEQVMRLIQAGARPLLALGGRDETGRLTRDEMFSSLPILTEMSAVGGPRIDAFHAAAIAARLECMLVLPHLTPADRVALWRQAATEASAALNVQVLARSVGARVISGPEASAMAIAAVVKQPALLALRQWLAARYHWKPA